MSSLLSLLLLNYLPPPSKLQIWNSCHDSSVTDTSLNTSIYWPKSLLIYLVFSTWLTLVLSPTSRVIIYLDNAVPIRMTSPIFCLHSFWTSCCNFHFLHQPRLWLSCPYRYYQIIIAWLQNLCCSCPTLAKISYLSSLSSLEFYFL